MNLIQQTNHRRIPTAADYAPLIHLGMESNVMDRPGVSDDAKESTSATTTLLRDCE
ncbi:hypothetical protein DPMN_186158 [Dreissena polymorpha]|uniref:Uncharacterized protein n=1 Tax=Dreissena polymorpha TaxID=45954 RepID=A0A9D4DN98_DREPO|nr:hypothetical protein DPMN_186158 [Dreissena polymorpha]